MALAPLMVASSLAQSEGKSALRVVSLGWLGGVVYFTGTLYWVVGTIATYGGLPWFVAALVGALLVAYLAIYPALFAWLLGRAVRRFGVAGIWLAPFLWVATEWVRSSFGGGFPWALLGASQSRVIPVVQLASVTGVYGLSFLVALVNAAGAVVLVLHGSRKTPVEAVHLDAGLKGPFNFVAYGDARFHGGIDAPEQDFVA